MKKFQKTVAAIALIALIGSSMSSLALAHGGHRGGSQGFGGFGMSGGMIPQANAQSKADSTTPSDELNSSEEYKGGFNGGRGHRHGFGGSILNQMGKGKINVHQQKYMNLLIAAYAPELKQGFADYNATKAALQKQIQDFATAQKGLKHVKPAKPDQTTLDARKAAKDTLKAANTAFESAIQADNDADIAKALKGLLDAQKAELTQQTIDFLALKNAQTAPTTTPGSTPTTSPGTLSPASTTSTSAITLSKLKVKSLKTAIKKVHGI